MSRPKTRPFGFAAGAPLARRHRPGETLLNVDVKLFPDRGVVHLGNGIMRERVGYTVEGDGLRLRHPLTFAHAAGELVML